mgnify:CR=1 FL=1
MQEGEWAGFLFKRSRGALVLRAGNLGGPGFSLQKAVDDIVDQKGPEDLCNDVAFAGDNGQFAEALAHGLLRRDATAHKQGDALEIVAEEFLGENEVPVLVSGAPRIPVC